MENINITNSQKGNHLNLKVYCELDEYKTLSLPLENHTTEKNSAQIFITKEDNLYQVKTSKELNDLSFKVSKENLYKSITLLTKKKLTLIKEDFKEIRFSKKKISILDSPYEFMIKNSFDLNNLEEFINLIQSSEFFKSFESIYLFEQEKGRSTSYYTYFNNSKAKRTKISSQEFHKLFTAIKKSKNGSFGQSTLKASNFQIIGTCLAKEISLETHNAILILTNDDFLDQTKEDIETFNDLIPALSFALNMFFKKEFYQRQYLEIKEALQNFSSNKSEFDFNFDTIDEKLKTIRKEHFDIFDVSHAQRLSLLGELLNTLRHELSNPLFGLQLSANLIETDCLEPDDMEILEEINVAIERCQSIITNFSDLYFNQSKLEQIDLIKLIKEVITLTKSRSKHIKKNIYYNGPLADDTTRVLLPTNKTLLAQVFFNLIINSTQAIGEKSDAQIDLHINDTKSDFLEITIQDNGPGLLKLTKEQLFSPFFTTKEDGTGLGLSICKNILEKLNGNIDNLESDNGAKFLIKLPYEYSNS